ncbi:MAG: PP2C family protein-serine/threonine phosphatase [Candidatus Omnitrophota bacterium]
MKESNEILSSDRLNDTLFLLKEIENFQDIIKYIKPSSGEIPHLNGIDMFGGVIPYNTLVGGDHIIYVDFNQRYDLDRRIAHAEKRGLSEVVEKLKLNKRRAGVLVADVSGHKITDAMLSAMLHQAFLIGVQYELKQHGEVTAGLFESLNTRFYNSSSFSKFITLIYGEIWDNGNFRFLNAGHPMPVVFSYKLNKLIKICRDQVIHYPPMGMLPSDADLDSRRNFSRLGYKKKYNVNDIELMGMNDILILYTDGLMDHYNESEEFYFPDRLESILREAKTGTAREIYSRVKEDILKFAKPSDDVALVIIKRV